MTAHRHSGTIALVIGLLGGAASAAAQSEPAVIPMELLANRPVIRATVNGQGPFAFLITPEDDTTLIDRELAEQLKLKEIKRPAGGNGTMPALTVEIAFGAGKTAGPPATIPVLVGDLSRAAPEVGAAARPRGIISLSVWKDQIVTIDYARWQIVHQPGALPDPNGQDVFALTAERQLRLPLAIAEQTVECRVDPLYPGGLLLPPAYAAAVPVASVPKDFGELVTRDGPVHVHEARLAATALLGPFELKSPLVLIANRGEMATIGTRWLGRFAVTYDLANGRARLERLSASGR